MKHLMRLERKKIKLKGYIMAAIILIAFLLFFSTIAIYASIQDSRNDYNNIIRMINVVIIESFIIYSSVLMAKIVIEEYTNKTIMIMFSYPIKRNKLIISKLCIVSIATILCILVANISCAFYLIGFDAVFDTIIGSFNITNFYYWVEQVIIGILIAGVFPLFTFFIGMHKKSIAATITSSFFLVVLIQVILSQTTDFLETLLSVIFSCLIIIGLTVYSFKRDVEAIES